jgi:uncharacterized repeat protein (TIGR03803 family)
MHPLRGKNRGLEFEPCATKKEENPMQGKKCLRTLAWAQIVAAAALALSGAARASTYKIIHKFEVPKVPLGNLTMDAAGNLYGTTSYGGSSACTFAFGGCGVVWKLAPNPDGTWGKLSVLHQFKLTDGAYPADGLIFDPAGNLYGTTALGGSTACEGGCGVVFKLAPHPDGTWMESVLHKFTGGANGEDPLAGLIFDAAGNLYGTTFYASSQCPPICGVVFRLAPHPDGTWTESVLHKFDGGAEGGGPNGRLIFDAAGNLYGTTLYGGSMACEGGCGVVFKLAPQPDGTWTESVLHSFAGEDGAYCYAGLIFDAAGSLYGTTSAGGNYDAGVVFKLAPNADGTWMESVLYGFTGGADGLTPYAGLTFDPAGSLYGTTYFGGFKGNATCADYGCGVVFKLTPTSSGWSETVLRKFLGQATGPFGPVIFDPSGNLFGTTQFGTGNYGVVFEITP